MWRAVLEVEEGGGCGERPLFPFPPFPPFPWTPTHTSPPPLCCVCAAVLLCCCGLSWPPVWPGAGEEWARVSLGGDDGGSRQHLQHSPPTPPPHSEYRGAQPHAAAGPQQQQWQVTPGTECTQQPPTTSPTPLEKGVAAAAMGNQCCRSTSPHLHPHRIVVSAPAPTTTPPASASAMVSPLLTGDGDAGSGAADGGGWAGSSSSRRGGRGGSSSRSQLYDVSSGRGDRRHSASGTGVEMGWSTPEGNTPTPVYSVSGHTAWVSDESSGGAAGREVSSIPDIQPTQAQAQAQAQGEVGVLGPQSGGRRRQNLNRHRHRQRRHRRPPKEQISATDDLGNDVVLEHDVRSGSNSSSEGGCWTGSSSDPYSCSSSGSGSYSSGSSSGGSEGSPPLHTYSPAEVSSSPPLQRSAMSRSSHFDEHKAGAHYRSLSSVQAWVEGQQYDGSSHHEPVGPSHEYRTTPASPLPQPQPQPHQQHHHPWQVEGGSRRRHNRSMSSQSQQVIGISDSPISHHQHRGPENARSRMTSPASTHNLVHDRAIRAGGPSSQIEAGPSGSGLNSMGNPIPMTLPPGMFLPHHRNQEKIVSLGDGASAELLSEGERALLFKASTEMGQGSSGSISFGSGPGNGGTGTGVESSPSLWHLQDHPFAPPSSAVPLDCGAIAACEVDGDIIQPQPHVALPPLQLYPLLEGRGGQTGKVGRVLLPAEQEQQQQPLRSTLRRDQSAVGQPQEGRHHNLQKRQHLHRHHRHGHRHGGAGGYRHHHYLAEHDNALFSGRMRSRSLCSTVSDLDPLDIPPSPVHQHLGEVEIPASPASLGGDLREGETEVRIRHGRSISVSVSISGTGGSDASSTSTVHHHHHHHHHHHLYLVHKGESNSREQHSVDTPASPSRPHHRRGRSASLFEPNTGSISLPKSGSLRIPPRSDHGRSHRRGTKYNDLLLSPKDAKRPRPTRANPPPNPQRQEKRLSTGDTSRTRPGHGHSQSAIDERTYLMRQDTTDSLGAYVGPAPQMHVPGLRNSGRGSSSRTSLYTDERTESRYSDCSDIPSEAGPHGFPLNSHHSASDQEANRSASQALSFDLNLASSLKQQGLDPQFPSDEHPSMDSRHALVSGSLAQVSPNPADGSTSDVGAMEREFGHRNESTPFASGASGQQDSNLNVFRGKAGNALGVPAVAGRHQRSYSVNETTQAARALSIVREPLRRKPSGDTTLDDGKNPQRHLSPGALLMAGSNSTGSTSASAGRGCGLVMMSASNSGSTRQRSASTNAGSGSFPLVTGSWNTSQSILGSPRQSPGLVGARDQLHRTSSMSGLEQLSSFGEHSPRSEGGGAHSAHFVAEAMLDGDLSSNDEELLGVSSFSSRRQATGDSEETTGRSLAFVQQQMQQDEDTGGGEHHHSGHHRHHRHHHHHHHHHDGRRQDPHHGHGHGRRNRQDRPHHRHHHHHRRHDTVGSSTITGTSASTLTSGSGENHSCSSTFSTTSRSRSSSYLSTTTGTETDHISSGSTQLDGRRGHGSRHDYHVSRSHRSRHGHRTQGSSGGLSFSHGGSLSNPSGSQTIPTASNSNADTTDNRTNSTFSNTNSHSFTPSGASASSMAVDIGYAPTPVSQIGPTMSPFSGHLPTGSERGSDADDRGVENSGRISQEPQHWFLPSS